MFLILFRIFSQRYIAAFNERLITNISTKDKTSKWVTLISLNIFLKYQ